MRWRHWREYTQRVCVEYMSVCASVCKVGVCLPGGYGDNAAVKKSSLSAGLSEGREERRGEARFQWAHEEHEEGNSLHQQDHVFLMASVSLLMLKDLFCSLFVQSLRALFNSKITKTIRLGISSCLMPLSLFWVTTFTGTGKNLQIQTYTTCLAEKNISGITVELLALEKPNIALIRWPWDTSAAE